MSVEQDEAPQKAASEEVPDETRAESARVETGYHSLDAEGTKRAYDELNGALGGFADTVIHTLEQLVPYLAEMQSLLSQRGAARKKVLATAGLPSWTVWAEAYSTRFDCSVRTVQEHIKLFRAAKENGATGKKDKGTCNDNKLRLDYRQQSALVKAQLAANGIVDALKNGGDWKTAVAEYEKVAITPAKLDSFTSTLNQETNWQDVVTQLVAKLERYGDHLPVAVTTEMRGIRKLLEGQRVHQFIAAKAPAGDEKATRDYRVEMRKIADDAGFQYAVLQGKRKVPYGFYSTRTEAESMCESLNTAPVASIGGVA